MSNREKYTDAFSKLHSGYASVWEISGITHNRKRGLRMRKTMAVLACLIVLTFAVSGIAYAATDGQIINAVKVWINGEEQVVNTDEQFVVEMDKGDKVVIEDGDIRTEVQAETDVKVKQNGDETEVEIEHEE